MLERQITIINKLGLHARASAKLVSTASAYAAEIMLEKDGQAVNAKSIMGVMMLAASCGSEVVLRADGVDAEAAMEAIVDLINSKFGEDE
jgi:phosphocarrier protein HPr